jgi:Cys-rich protein (TIGR01571 family)
MDVSSRGLNRRSVLVLNSHSAVTTEPTHQNECRRWKTGISPFIDEEICWWGYWCCWLVQARTADSFGVGSSRVQITYSFLYLVGSALTFYFISPFAGISFAIIGSIVLACIRASVRSGIRRKLNIFGTFFDDFLTHLCCPSCAICQEAREGKVLRNDPIDFCTGEKLLVQEETYRNNTGQNKRSSADTAVEVRKIVNETLLTAIYQLI